MNIIEQSRDGAVVKVKVEFPALDIDKSIEKAFSDAKKNVVLDGFRAGKVPLSVIKKRFGDTITSDAIDDFIKEKYPVILEKTELRPVTPGDIQDVKYVSGESLTFTAVVEIMPEFTLENWKGTKVEKDVVLVTDDDVNNHLEMMRRNEAIIAERLDHEGAEKSDRLTVNLQELDASGVPVIGHKREDVPFELGYNALGENTDEQLIGICKDEERQIKAVRKTKDENGNELDEEFSWQIKALKIESIELPELDKDFISNINENLETLDDLKVDIKKNLESMGMYHANQKLAGKLIEKIVELHPFDLPPSLLAETLERMVQSNKEESNNMISEDVLRKQLENVAENQLRWFFIRSRIIAENSIEASDEDIEKELQRRADLGQGDLESLKLTFKSGEKREQIAGVIIDGKVMDVLHEGFDYEERTVDLASVVGQM